MARQRFIHPSIWEDPIFGRLDHAEQVLFIGLFSIADDDGRLVADPANLGGTIFRYKGYSPKKVQAIRDSLAGKCENVHVYQAKGIDYIALLKWKDYQRPQYPKPSKLPAPFVHPSANPDGSDDEDSNVGWVGLDRDGLGRAGMGGDGQGRDGASPDGDAESPADKSAFQMPNLKDVEAA